MSQGRGCDTSAPHPLPCKCLAKAGGAGGGQFPKVKTPGVALGKMEGWGLECQSNKAFWSQGGREVVKVMHQKAHGGFGGIESPFQEYSLPAFEVKGS